MNALILGATGMVGHGVLNAALADDRIEHAVTLGRRATKRSHPKLGELVVDDLFDLSDVEERLSGFDFCVFTVGVSAAGMSEADYRRLTYDMTLSVARVLARLNPHMTFIYISGAATDVDSRQMWARVKGETEQALKELPFEAVYSARPGYIQPVGGAVSGTKLYRALYAVASPLYPLLKRVAPNHMIDSDELGHVLIEVGMNGARRQTLETGDLRSLADDLPSTSN